MADQAPVTILTGFLGAGKTTLLNRLLRHPGMAGAAVLVNEFGEIGLDHILAEAVRDDTLLLPSGCLCCAVGGDLARALRDLIPRNVTRVVVETTGLADPAPVVQTLMSDLMLMRHYRLDGIVTVVDAINGLASLDTHEEAVRQAAMADRIVISKTDLAPATDALRARLAALNPGAPLITAIKGEVEPDEITNCGFYDLDRKTLNVRRWLDEAAWGKTGAHDGRIHSFCLTFDEPLHWQGIGTCLEMLIGTRGESLLRVKGILNLVGQERPVVIHGVQHMFHEPELLPAWPEGDPRTSRIVFITRDLDRATIEEGLLAFDKAAKSP
jgi:G3E family GTPase